MDQNRAKDILEGIVQLAYLKLTGSRSSKIPEKHRVKTGGPGALKEYLDWYITTQESDDPSQDLSINTAIARDLHLIKKNWRIRLEPEGKVMLSVVEWHWQKDFPNPHQNYRTIWMADVDDPGVKAKMADMLCETLRSVGASNS